MLEEDPQPAMHHLLWAALWGFCLVLAVNDVLRVCFQAIKSYKLVLAPENNPAEIPAEMLELISAGSFVFWASCSVKIVTEIPRASTPTKNIVDFKQRTHFFA